MKKLLLTMALCAITAVMQAVPARRNVHTVAQSDGSTLKIRLRGDESFHYLETADGHPIVNTSNGYMYGKVENGRLMSSGILAHDAAMRSVSEQSHLRFSGSLTRSGVSRLWNIRKESRNQHRMARHNKFRAMQESESVKSRVGATSTTTKKGLVILVNFANKTMKSLTANADFDEMFNKVGYNKNRHIGSVRDYFTDQSHGQLTIDFDIVGPYNLSNDMSYYGKNNSDDDDLRPGEMIAEACRLANGDVNFKDYDWDGDGEVDQVYVVYAGYGESSGAPSSTIWPHEWELTSSDYGKSLRLDNVTINTYACSNELAGTSGSRMDGIGTACHEFSHCLGLPDLYDTDEEDGMNFGMDSWSLMDYGCYNGPDGYNGNVPCAYTAYEKFYCGWIEPTVLDEGCNVEGMKAITDSDDSYIIYNDGNKNEYYVLFNIQQKSWNQYAEGHGMLVIHVDYNESVWESNGVNAKEGHPRCTIIPADNEFTTEVEYDGEIYDVPDLTGDPYPGSKTNTSLTDTSTPAATLYSNNSNGKKLLSRPIEDIVEKDGLISFKFNGGKLLDTPVANEAQSIGADSFIASWNAVEGAEDSLTGGWEDMMPFSPSKDDVLVGIAASGTTPYVIGAIRTARSNGLLTGCITCNENSPVAAAAEIPVVVVVGPEFVTGSTRMKAGTAQKLVLNMISTASMIRLGHVRGSKMVDMQLTNHKLVDRGTRMIMEETGIEDYDYARSLLLQHGSVREAVASLQSKTYMA